MLATNHLLLAVGAELEDLRPHIRDVELKVRQVLSEPGDDLRTVYFLHDGLVSKVAAFEDGTEIDCVIVGREGAVGAMTALGLRTALTRDICRCEAAASAIDAQVLRAALRRSPRVATVMHRYCIWKMSCAIRNGACNAVHKIEQRLARWLMTACDTLGEDDIRLPQDVLGKMLGVQRSSINPLLQKFRGAGLIDFRRSHIVVNDRAGLTRRACSCYVEETALREEMERELAQQPQMASGF